MNVWAVVNRWINKVAAEVTHCQLAASVENDLADRWRREFIGPKQKCYSLPFTVCCIDALSCYYPSVAA
ncbi:hypothetical protein D3C81_295540 [compost metagenome]